MELRPPPLPEAPAGRADRSTRWLLAALTGAVVALAVVVWLRPAPAARSGAGDARLVADRLLAAGLVDEAADLYERHLASGGPPPARRARIAFSLGEAYLERGDAAAALRWLYEAEAAGGGGELAGEIDRKVVHALEALGRRHAARAALEERSRMPEEAPAATPPGDPVVARVGEREVRRSEVERWLDELPPVLAAAFDRPGGRAEALRRYLAEELLWRKAERLEYDRDPEVVRRHEALLRQLAVTRLIEREVVDPMEVDAADLATFFEANRERYRPPDAPADEPGPELDRVREAVERDYRRYKVEAAWEAMVEAELDAASVQLWPERMGDAG